MKKIPSLFQRDPNDRQRVTLNVTPGCEWVLAGLGIPTRKWNGTCVRFDATGRWWARRTVKLGKTVPDGFMLSDCCSPLSVDELPARGRVYDDNVTF